MFSTSGDVTINADRMVIDSASGIIAQAPGHSVTIQPASSAWAVDLGSITDTAANTLELADAELDRIFTPTLRIGSTSNWPAPGSEDTELGVILEPEVVYGTQTLCTRIQA